MAMNLRLGERELELLAEVQEFLEIKTASGTIKQIIRDYMDLRRQYDDLKFSNNALSNNHYKLCSSLKDVVSVLNEHNSEFMYKILSE